MTFSQVAQVVVIVLAFCGVYGFVATARDGETRRACTALCALKPDYAGRNRTAPDFELPGLDGRPVRLSSYRGKTVILHFWTKTCRPCLEELPHIASLAKALRPYRGSVELVTVTTDESAEDARATLTSVIGSADGFTVLIDPDGDKVVNGKYGTKLFPETWMIDPKGVIRARFDGARDWSGAIAVELAEKVAKPGTSCPVEFFKSKARGKFSGLCEDEL